MTQIKESDFQLVEKEQNDFLSIKIKKGSYKNVIYTYGKVSINEDKENDVATLKFSYNIEETPKKWTKEQLDDWLYEIKEKINNFNIKEHLFCQHDLLY